MPRLAEAEAHSARFWFRQHYLLPPTDPRYLEMTDEGIVLEHEAFLAFRGEPLKTCVRCGAQTHRKHCPNPQCRSAKGEEYPLTGDADMDALNARAADGEELTPEEIERALRGPFERVGGT